MSVSRGSSVILRLAEAALIAGAMFAQLGCHRELVQSSLTQRGYVKTVLLHIDLQDGFVGEPVVVRVNGNEVFRQADLATDFRIGLAHSLEVPVVPGRVTIEVALEARKLSDRVTIDVAEPGYLGVSVTQDDQIRFRISRQPFGYL